MRTTSVLQKDAAPATPIYCRSGGPILPPSQAGTPAESSNHERCKEDPMRMMVTVGATVVAVLSGAGCYVASVAPLYSNDAVVLDDGLPGTWVNDDGDTWWITSAEHPLK